MKILTTLSLALVLTLLAVPATADAAVSRHDRIDAHSTDIWTVTLKAGVYHRIVVDGDGDTDLDVYLYDENGNLLDSDTDLTDYCVVGVTPRWTGTFKVRIKNLGRVYNDYHFSIR